ncbi:MAG: type VI secretion system lipoprotein TssJ [Kiloniellaceae bacterium]
MQDYKRNTIRCLSACAIALTVSGCLAGAAGSVAGKLIDKMFEPSPTRMEAKIGASEDVNPDYDGQPSPLVVRLYELKSPTSFNNAAFFALYDSDVAALGGDLQNREEIELQPGQALEIERELKPETRYIGVMAAYRDIDNAAWRAVHEVEEGATAELAIDFARLSVTITETD